MFFPLLTVVSGSSLPLAIVESCSMHHENTLFSDFDSWWQDNKGKYSEYDIKKSEFEDFKMKNGFTKGDILFITGTTPGQLEKGDVIVFHAGRNKPIIHRIVEIEENNGDIVFSTIGDNNAGQLRSEERITPDEIVGKASFRIAPYIGWIKLIFYEPMRPASQKGFC